jgi:CheY-like chemotaxis protein
MVNKAILWVDDERIVLLSLRDQIAKHFGDRFRYEVAESVPEAWEVIAELGLDEVKLLVIVSDWLMPGIRGDEFLIQVHQRLPEVITVLLSGQADPAAIERARLEANLFAYLAKPWDEATLLQTIQSGLEQADD